MDSSETEPQKKQRKKSPPRKGRWGAKTRRPRPFNPETHFFSKPESRWAKSKGGKKGGKISSRTGIPDGFRREDIEPLHEQAKVFADKVVSIMVKKGVVAEDDEYAKEALKEAVMIMKTPQNQDVRLRAARLVLDFCKQKPVAKVEALVRAEDFLEELAAEEEYE